MGFFSDIGKKGADATTKLAKEGKLKIKIAENKGKIKDVYNEIGKKIYEKHVREENIDIEEYLKEELKSIDALSKEIENARKEILEVNNKKLCSNCFEEMSKDMAFCPKCGAKQENKESVKEEALEKLEEAEISDDNKKEADTVKEELKQAVETEQENNENNENKEN